MKHSGAKIIEEAQVNGSDYALRYCHRHFSQELFNRLLVCQSNGKVGWDKPDIVTDEWIKERIRINLEQGDYVDVANLAMILWNRQDDNKKEG